MSRLLLTLSSACAVVASGKDYLAAYEQQLASGGVPTFVAPAVTAPATLPGFAATPDVAAVPMQSAIDQASATMQSGMQYQVAEQCQTVDELRRWRVAQKAQISKFVPANVRSFALQKIEDDFKTRFQELSVTGKAPVQTVVVGPPPKKFPQMLAEAEGCQSMEELNAWQQAVAMHVQSKVPMEYRSQAIEDVQSAYDRRFDELKLMAERAAPSGPAAVQLVAQGAPAAPAISQAPSEQVFPAFLHAVVNCKSEDELAAWHLAIMDYVRQSVPAEMRPLAMRDVQKHYEGRLAEILPKAPVKEAQRSPTGNVALSVAKAPLQQPAQMLAKMFNEADQCNDEAQLRTWRQNTASHIRVNIPQRFQIPALTELQLRFEKHLHMMKVASANAQAVADGKNVDTVMGANTSTGSHFGSCFLVLLGLALPAFLAFANAFFRSKKQSDQMQQCYQEYPSEIALLPR